jgi:DNA (cytosine-5)-methyltransferase 1
LAAAGFEIRVMVEWDKSACETLRINWIERPENWRGILAKEMKRKPKNKHDAMFNSPHYWWQERPPAILNVDITKTSTEEILTAAGLKVGEATILEGGFPCQGFSVAGPRMIDDPRNVLYKECVRIIGEALPRTFFLENVPGLVSMDKGRIIKQICDDLASAGYVLTWDIHNAADYGVPQNRKRVLFVGTRTDIASFDVKSGKISVHMGALQGQVTHPSWFKAKYPNLFQQTLFATAA